MRTSQSVPFVVHSKLSGEILRTGSCAPDFVDLQAGPGEAAIVGTASDTDNYVSGGMVVVRPEFSCCDTYSAIVGEAVCIPCPDGSEISVGEDYLGICVGGRAEIDFPYAGTYWVTLNLFPYKTKVIKIEIHV